MAESRVESGAMDQIRVECYSGRRADERPLRFFAGEHVYEVKSVEDKWYSPDATYFRVIADDGNLYVLRHDEQNDIWTMEAFRAQRRQSKK
ncbi:MAG TPA: hypothetical protein VFU57_09850 [Candidatus Acidoferrales bacterium]|nr:hypothetical protein [Candidatus Acidoferrales bacterium]